MTFLPQLEKSLLTIKAATEAIRKQQRRTIAAAVGSVRHRIDQAYLDKLDGKISEEFWTRNQPIGGGRTADSLALQGLEQQKPGTMLERVSGF